LEVFGTPAAGVRGIVREWPASENLHNTGHGSERRCQLSADIVEKVEVAMTTIFRSAYFEHASSQSNAP
jgi:hypothetical protein